MRVPCWQIIGIDGDRSCPELAQHIHCRNCPTFVDAAREFLDREPEEDYIDEVTGLNTNMSSGALRDEGMPVMAFRLGAEWHGLPVGVIDQIHPVAPIRRVPHRTNPGFLGLTAIDGQIELCMSLHAVLGVDDGDGKPAAGIRRWLMLKLGEERWVAPVDEIMGVVRVDPKHVRHIPATLERSPDPASTGIFEVDDLRVSLLAPDPLLRRFKACLA
ncbi:MAG: chemotaxis protein CheW [Sphingomonadales bacterium]